LKIDRVYRDVVSNETVNVKDKFVESLSHDLYVVQISKLKMVAQSELEQILDVFNVSKYKTDDKHVLEYTGVTTNPKVARIIKHLSQAMKYEEIVEAMKSEDEVEDALNAERKSTNEERKEKERKAKEEALLQVKEEQKAKEEILKELEELKKQFKDLQQKQNRRKKD
jgi:hypothetical protein